jgi:hypothetical protein
MVHVTPPSRSYRIAKRRCIGWVLVSKKVRRAADRAAAALSQRQCDTVGRKKVTMT